MSRWAMMLPIVARRSPAITTPPGKVAATIVVPCGARSAALPSGRERRLGSSSGACSVRNSANDEEPGRRNAGPRRGSLTRLLPALLDERLHEVLGVRLEDVVDLVEDRVDVLVELFLALRDVTLRGSLSLFLGLRGLLRLLVLLCHERSPGDAMSRRAGPTLSTLPSQRLEQGLRRVTT